MFAKYGPGFLGGFIGVAITRFIFQQINIIYCFSESLKTLQAKVKVRDLIVRMGTNSEVLLSELVQEASDMVKEGHNVPRWNLIRRYRISKRMAKLILDINKERYSLLSEIVIHQTSAARNPAAEGMAAEEQEVVHTDAVEKIRVAAEEQAVAQTDSVGETAAAKKQEVVHTDAVEEIRVAAEEQAVAQTDAVEETAAAEEQKVLHTVTVERMAIADEMGLRQRVGTRKEVVHTDAVEKIRVAAEEQAVAQTDSVGETATAKKQEVVHTDAVEEIRVAAEEQAVAQTDAVEETAAAEEQKVLHTVTVERMAIADEMGLRQRVGTRKKIVLKLMIENEKIKKRAINAIAGVGGVESVSVDIETKEVVVVGEADPVFLTAKLRKIGITELMSVGPAIEEKKAEGEKKEGPKE